MKHQEELIKADDGQDIIKICKIAFDVNKDKYD
jgi:hypothetical protein